MSLLTVSRFATALTLLVSALSVGCASHHDAGEALIATGTVVALATSGAATGRGVCIETGCAAQTSKHAAQAAAGVAAGVALAAAGAALASEPDTDSASAPVARSAPATGSWRLVRKADGEEPPAYYIEE